MKKQDDTINKTGKEKAPVKSTGNKPKESIVKKIGAAKQNKTTESKTKEQREKPAFSEKQNKPIERKAKTQRVKPIGLPRQNKTTEDNTKALIVPPVTKQPLLDDKTVSKQMAQDLYDRAICCAKVIGQVGLHFRKCVYKLVLHNVHEALGMKQSQILADLSECSTISRSNMDNLRIAAETEIKFKLPHGRWSVNAMVAVYRIKDKQVQAETVSYIKFNSKKHECYMSAESIMLTAKTIAVELKIGDYLAPAERREKQIEEHFNGLVASQEEEDQDPEECKSDRYKTHLGMLRDEAEDIADKKYFVGDAEIAGKYEEGKPKQLTEFDTPIFGTPLTEFTREQLEWKMSKRFKDDPYDAESAYEEIEKRVKDYSVGEIKRLKRLLNPEGDVAQDAVLIWHYFSNVNRETLLVRLDQLLAEYEKANKSSRNKS